MKKLSFTSDHYGRDHAFGAYHDLYSGGSDVARIDDRFHADVVGFRFPRMLIFDRTLRGVSHERTARRVFQDGFDHVMMQIVMSGQMWIDTDGTPRLVREGELVVFDLTKPQRTWMDAARIATVSIARDALDTNLAIGREIHGHIVDRTHAAFFASYISGLMLHAETMTPEVAAAATATTGLLLGATLNSSPGAAPPPVRRAVQVHRVMAFIDANLRDPNLSIDNLIKATSLSRSVLYRMFEPMGGVFTCIQDRRLRAIKHTLSQPQERRSVSAIIEDFGFASASTGHRAFRRAFGLPPTAFRAALAVSRSADIFPNVDDASMVGAAGEGKRFLATWHVELS